MKLSHHLAVKAVLSLIYGITFAVIPATIWSLFGMTLDPADVFLTRLSGGFLIGIGLVCWLDRNAELQARQGIALALFLGDIVVTIAVLLAQIDGLVNALGWVNVAVCAYLTAGLGYFRFLKPDAS